ncbi:hypothetical protein FBUS_07745 [Fasciolopsis buskii]|uniref:Uncharacterized protein n=1 Tax=Fasciolopsis buskii TaxID=27845 RepID=A0A8E0VIM7_9TREM|nr:hypothetical protein FBUS_07745 [Fasciolopsis buski]
MATNVRQLIKSFTEYVFPVNRRELERLESQRRKTEIVVGFFVIKLLVRHQTLKFHMRIRMEKNHDSLFRTK